MNKEQSILSDIFLEDSMLFENKNNSNITSIKKVIKSNEKLKNLSDIEIRYLLHIIRKEQVKLHSLLIEGGEEILKTHDTHIEDFLNDGGFQKIYKDRLKKYRFEFIKFLIPLTTLGILVYMNFIKESDLTTKKETLENTTQSESLKQDQSEVKQKNIKKDSLENHYHKSTNLNRQNDSLTIENP